MNPTMPAAAGARPLGWGRWFYVSMAVVCALVAWIGFSFTFWAPIARGTFNSPPVVGVHAALFFAWTILFIVQTTLAARHRIDVHRALGLVGISLATAMLFLGLMVATGNVKHWLGTPSEGAARVQAIVPVAAITTFAGLFGAAIANIRRPEWHKRFMLLATIALLPPAVARYLFVAFAHAPPGMRPGLTPPPATGVLFVPAFIADLLVIAPLVFDWRTRARPHPAYLWGGGAMLIVQLLRAPISATPAWRWITDWLLKFIG